MVAMGSYRGEGRWTGETLLAVKGGGGQVKGGSGEGGGIRAWPGTSG